MASGHGGRGRGKAVARRWLECDFRCASWTRLPPTPTPRISRMACRDSIRFAVVVVETCDCAEMCVARGAPSRRRELGVCRREVGRCRGERGSVAESWGTAQRRATSAEVTSLSRVAQCTDRRQTAARRRRKMERESGLRENGAENAVVKTRAGVRFRAPLILRLFRFSAVLCQDRGQCRTPLHPHPHSRPTRPPTRPRPRRRSSRRRLPARPRPAHADWPWREGQGWAGRRRGRRALRGLRLPGLSRRRGDAQGNQSAPACECRCGAGNKR
ncbi:hypothetical protein C8R45DRAFT_1043640 [Mycena sanguinolenta]|nr:hypothetical protein C8R45DRAFT_1043640 [Mycena sanguinolenta]